MDDAIYEHIGKVATEWSYLEERLKTAVELLASYGLERIHEPCRILVAGMAFDAQLEVLKTFLTIGPMADPEELQWVKRWAGDVKQSQAKRNIVVHSAWVYDEESEEPTALAVDARSRRARMGLNLDAFPDGIDGLPALIDRIRELQGEMGTWTQLQFLRYWPTTDSVFPAGWPKPA